MDCSSSGGMNSRPRLSSNGMLTSKGQYVNGQCGFTPLHARADNGFVYSLENAVYRVVMLAAETPLHKEREYNRGQRNDQHGIHQHDKGFSIRQRVEQLALLPFQQEHRQKRSQDDNGGIKHPA